MTSTRLLRGAVTGSLGRGLLSLYVFPAAGGRGRASQLRRVAAEITARAGAGFLVLLDELPAGDESHWAL